jgi:hypothetical protein
MKEELDTQLKPRLFGGLLVVIAILLLLIGFLLVVFLRPAAGQYYSGWVVALVVLLLLGGYGALFPGIWKLLVGPGVGMFAGLLKVVAVGALLVATAFAGLSATAVYAMVKGPVPESSGYSGSDWD